MAKEIAGFTIMALAAELPLPIICISRQGVGKEFHSSNTSLSIASSLLREAAGKRTLRRCLVLSYVWSCAKSPIIMPDLPTTTIIMS